MNVVKQQQEFLIKEARKLDFECSFGYYCMVSPISIKIIDLQDEQHKWYIFTIDDYDFFHGHFEDAIIFMKQKRGLVCD